MLLPYYDLSHDKGTRILLPSFPSAQKSFAKLSLKF